MAGLDCAMPAPQGDLVGLALDLAISPAGRVYLEIARGVTDAPASPAATRIRKAFERSGAHALLQLGAVELGGALTPALAFGREFAHLFMVRLTALATLAEDWASVARPPRSAGTTGRRSASNDGCGIPRRRGARCMVGISIKRSPPMSENSKIECCSAGQRAAKSRGAFLAESRSIATPLRRRSAMRISIQACIEGEGSQPSKVITVGVIEREDRFAPGSGLGLFMRETHALLKQLQTVVLDEQVDQFVRRSARCFACGAPLGIKDTKRLVYRTTFGNASLRSPRFYSRCSGCGFCSSDKATVSSLAHALPQRVHPQWSWLQC
ncbi:hypothetical protein LJR175_007862 [Variovorax sp. LjRoot175]|uniref:hypothetical protein n=1 Tax=Variovorax sp. LjRoot175 TaxID=3342276 RepID=UPI003ECC43FF